MTPYTPEVGMYIAEFFTCTIIVFTVYQVADIIEDWYNLLIK